MVVNDGLRAEQGLFEVVCGGDLRQGFAIAHQNADANSAKRYRLARRVFSGFHELFEHAGRRDQDIDCFTLSDLLHNRRRSRERDLDSVAAVALKRIDDFGQSGFHRPGAENF